MNVDDEDETPVVLHAVGEESSSKPLIPNTPEGTSLRRGAEEHPEKPLAQ